MFWLPVQSGLSLSASNSAPRGRTTATENHEIIGVIDNLGGLSKNPGRGSGPLKRKLKTGERSGSEVLSRRPERLAELCRKRHLLVYIGCVEQPLPSANRDLLPAQKSPPVVLA